MVGQAANQTKGRTKNGRTDKRGLNSVAARFMFLTPTTRRRRAATSGASTATTTTTLPSRRRWRTLLLQCIQWVIFFSFAFLPSGVSFCGDPNEVGVSTVAAVVRPPLSSSLISASCRLRFQLGSLYYGITPFLALVLGKFRILLTSLHIRGEPILGVGVGWTRLRIRVWQESARSRRCIFQESAHL